MTYLPKILRLMYIFFQIIEENGYIPGYPGKGGRGTAPDYVGKFFNGSFPENFKWGVAMSMYHPENEAGTNGNCQ